ncbi:hypothetical protein DCC39_02950 [Pueribacillus theae]|uniref:Putative restriction endonuclease domain-containing protein n=1 Tax=Pueribacillus theae TaxID=2171751 RepID=A0A2U1K6S5_9BACI|nr:Uma2 family endonuclease [Pueribacillus theae]PWA13102.1 hypothetical protein DCC39_02950 [Pueribacillus theae]
MKEKSIAKKDKKMKKELYEKARIKEYWIVDPNNEYIEVYLLGEHNKYEQADIFGREDRIKASIFEDFEFDLSAIFTE